MSEDNLKILGVNFDRHPNANFHVRLLMDKFYSRLWSLRFLKKNGMKEKDLVIAFNTIIRPSVEYAAIAYHTLIPNYLAEQLEQVQKHAMKIIYGWNMDYGATQW